MILYQLGFRGAAIAIHIHGDESPALLRYIAMFCEFQAKEVEQVQNPMATPGEIEYASWKHVAAPGTSGGTET